MMLFFAELKKDFIIILNDPRSLLAGIIAPSLVLIIFTLLFGGLSSTPISIINNDNGPWGTQLEEMILTQISPLGEIPYFANKETNYNEAAKKYKNELITGIIIIPEDFSQRLENGQEPEITYYLNNFDTDFAKNMRLYLLEGIYAFYREYYSDINIDIEEEFSVPVQVEWVDIIAIGTLLLAFIIGGMFSYLFIFFKEKQYGTLIIYNIAPRSPFASFIARIIIALICSLLAGMINALLILWILHINVFIYLPIIGGAIFFTVMIYISITALLSIFMKDFYSAVMLSMGVAMVLWFFSGGFNVNVPENPILLVIYRIVPNSYALDIMRGAIFKTNNLSNAISYNVLLYMMIASLICAVYFYINKLWKKT